MLSDVVFSAVVKSENVSNMFDFLSKPIWLRPRIGPAMPIWYILMTMDVRPIFTIVFIRFGQTQTKNCDMILFSARLYDVFFPNCGYHHKFIWLVNQSCSTHKIKHKDFMADRLLLKVSCSTLKT